MFGKDKTTHNSLLGIEFEHGWFHAVLAYRNGKGLHIKQTWHSPLALDPLNEEADVVGQEIRNQLDEAGIHEPHCVVCLPIHWILKHRFEIPDLPEADRKEYIHLQAEKEFPFAPHDLSLSTAEAPPIGEQKLLTMAAVPLIQVRKLEAICKAAGLKPISFSIGYPVLDPTTQESFITIHRREAGMDVRIFYQGSMVMFRWLETFDEVDQTEFTMDETLFREIRVTLSELPIEIRGKIKKAYVYGPTKWRHAFQAIMADSFHRFGIEIVPETIKENHIDPSALPLVGTLELLLKYQAPIYEFLPPKVSRMQQWVSRLSSRGNLLLGGAAAAIILLTITAFFYQHVTLNNLRSQWDHIEEDVAELESLQDRVKYFRPWFTSNMPSLQTLRTITLSFPEEGTVWVDRIEIDDLSLVYCSGFSQGNQNLFTVMDRLNEDENISQLQVQQFQGTSPMQFALNFIWLEG